MANYLNTSAVYYETEPPEIIADGDNFLIVSKLGGVELKRVMARKTLIAYINAGLAAIDTTDGSASLHRFRKRARKP